MADPVLRWSERRKDQQGTMAEFSREQDFSHLALSLEDHVEEALSEAGGAIDLSKAYPDCELAESLRVRVIALTAPSLRFASHSTNVTSEEIQKTIKDDWGAFAACPWAEDLTGRLALLKYLVENGERPRFWSGTFEGLYGFRVRTRDHSWITGEIRMVRCVRSAEAK
jgi:hypothetical protein